MTTSLGPATFFGDGNLRLWDGFAWTQLRTQAWWVLDLTPLWNYGNVRGSDRLVPNNPGVVAYPRRRTVTAYTLPMVIIGSKDQFGDPYDDVWEGLEANIDTLRAGTDPYGASDGTRLLLLEMPTSPTTLVTRSGRAHTRLVLGERWGSGDSQAILRAGLELSLPDGALT